MPSTSHWSGVRICTQATFVDAAMAITAFWGAAIVNGSREWFRRPGAAEWVVYLGVGLFLTIAFEWVATGPLQRWSYGPLMPRVPLLGTGLLPLVFLPPLALMLTARQLKDPEAIGSAHGVG